MFYFRLFYDEFNLIFKEEIMLIEFFDELYKSSSIYLICVFLKFKLYRMIRRIKVLKFLI